MTKLPRTIDVRSSRFSVLLDMRRTVGGYWSGFRTWRSRRAASRSMSALSDFQLKDIGLHRSEIGSVLRDTERRWRYWRH